MQFKKILLIIFVCILIEGVSEKRVYGFERRSEVQVINDHLDNRLFLPLIQQPDQFSNRTKPIWTHSLSPQLHEVVLFRKSFSIDTVVDAATLSIFADTRYEVWIDGRWVGRGPARFLIDYHEYDRYLIGSLSPGDHLIAVLVQWSPNTRRSESSVPQLRTTLYGKIGGNNQQLLTTDTSWKVYQASAWKGNAAPVHTWGIMGATELLDLRMLPVNWMLSEYSDVDWPFAVEINPTQISYQPLLIFEEEGFDSAWNPPEPFVLAFDEDNPEKVTYAPRSIKILDQTEVEFTLIDQGRLSLEKAIVELTPSLINPYQILFETTKDLTFEIEMLRSDNIPVPDSILLDGAELFWVPAGGWYPDVQIASVDLIAGTHELIFAGIPPEGVTLSIPTVDIVWEQIPFAQGLHAGRRLLLSTYHSDLEIIANTNNMISSISIPDMPYYLVIDLGRTVHGRLQMTINGTAGAVLDIGWDERLVGNPGRVLPFPGSLHPQWNQVDSWVLDGTQRKISTIDARSGRYILIAVWGQGPIILENIKILEEHYPLIQSGWFESNNELLNNIWQIGVDSTLVSMTDAYADPWRERGQWWGDAYVIDHANRVAFGNTDLLRRGVLLMAKAFDDDGRPVAMSPNGAGVHMVDYGMLWLHSLQEYQELSGDKTIIKELYPTVLEFMTYLEIRKNPITGLLDLPDGHWGGNSYIDTNGRQSRYGQSAAVNAMYFETLLRAAKLASEHGDEEQAIAWRVDANSIREGMLSELYLMDEHRYITRLFDNEIYPPTDFAQAWPLAYGAVLPDDVDSVVSALFELLSQDPKKPTVNVYGMYWVLEALGHSGYITEAIELIEIFYGYMLNRGATTWWERFDADQHQWASLSHGWGSSPTWFLTTYVLGARQIDENSWVVQPSFDGVTQVSGGLPINGDVLQVYWDQLQCQSQTIQIGSPENTSGRVIIPGGSLEQIILDDVLVWQNGVSLSDDVWVTSNDIYIQLGEGDFSILVHRMCK